MRKRLNKNYAKLYRKIKRLVRADVRPHEMRDEAMKKLYEMLLEAQGNGVSVQALLPQGFDVFYSEFVAELPAFTHEERLQRRSVMHFLYCTCITFLAVLLLFEHTPTDEYLTYLEQGVSYVIHNDDYIAASYPIDDTITIEIDFDDLESNVGKCVWEGENGKIIINRITIAGEGIKAIQIYFKSYPKKGFNYSEMVSGLDWARKGFTFTAKMTLDYEGENYNCGICGVEGTDRWGFYFFGIDFVSTHEDMEIEDLHGVYKFTLEGLTLNTWKRK
ncbi:MAG: hypothetical protein E7608_02430 [Ruminococcaceae bacterium]|nr:hypothetical protein [Oscillospiraceae bacterium]